MSPGFITDEWYLDDMGRPWKIASPVRMVRGSEVMVVCPWTSGMYHCNAYEVAVMDTPTTASITTDDGFTSISTYRMIKGTDVLDWVRKHTNGGNRHDGRTSDRC